MIDCEEFQPAMAQSIAATVADVGDVRLLRAWCQEQGHYRAGHALTRFVLAGDLEHVLVRLMHRGGETSGLFGGAEQVVVRALMTATHRRSNIVFNGPEGEIGGDVAQTSSTGSISHGKQTEILAHEGGVLVDCPRRTLI